MPGSRNNLVIALTRMLIAKQVTGAAKKVAETAEVNRSTSNREGQEGNTPNRDAQQGQQGQGQQGNVSNPGSSSMDQDDISKTKGDRGSQSGTGRSSDLDQDES